MIYTELTRKAMEIAYIAHHGQVDKSGTPYIYHPIHLAEQMDDEITCCAALLHDVVEDTHITLEDLSRNFPEEVIAILSLLTHRDDIPYFDYVRAIKSNPAAVKIKLADIAHNSGQSRLSGTTVSAEKKEQFRRKYAEAIRILTED